MALAAPLVLFPKSIISGWGVFMGLMTGSERDTIFPVVLAISDGIMSAVALTLGFIIRSKLLGVSIVFSKPLEYFYPLVVIFPLLVIIVFRQMGLYRTKTCLSKLNQLVLFFRAFAVVALVVMAGMFVLKMNYSRSLLLIVFLTALPLMAIARLILNVIHERMLAKGVNATRVLIVGAGEAAQMVLEKIHNFPALGYYVVGFIAEAGMGKRYLGREILGSSKDIRRIIAEHQVDEVIFARPSLSREKVLDLIVQLGKENIAVKMVSDLYDIVTSQTVIDGIADIPMIEIHKRRFRHLQDLIKSGIDYLLGTIFLLLSLPFWLIFALIIRIESPGPVFVRVDRIGKNGRRFKLFRFRTLFPDATLQEGGTSELNDPRATRFGRFLSKTRLDEWPQLLNILLGHMSLVGPRPELPELVAEYKEWQKLRLEVKPGITGLWQIMGRRDLFLHQNLEYDFYYIKNRSLLLDLTILLRTIPAMIFGSSPVYRGWLVNAELERQKFNVHTMGQEVDEKLTKSANA